MDTPTPVPSASLTPVANAGTAVSLRYPVTVAGVSYSLLTLRRPKVQDELHAEHAGGTQADKEVSVLASIAGVAPDVIAALDMADYKALQKAYTGFLS